MEQKVLNEHQQKRAVEINDMIARGVLPPMDELRASRNVLACGCPEHLLRSVVEKNARRARTKTLTNSRRVRSRITTPAITQEQINHLVDTRDLTKYPLSGYEKRVIANRKAAIDALLS
jgi:hypothetical protein